MARAKVLVRRIYDDIHDTHDTGRGGSRVLVDRVWPRGVRKDAARLDEWLRDVAPSTELRKWYGHDPEKFAEFRHRYRTELESDPAKSAFDRLRGMMADGSLTLLTATKDVELSQARVLADLLGGKK